MAERPSGIAGVPVDKAQPGEPVGAADAEEALERVWAVLDKVDAMNSAGPDAFKTGQEHLSPAFREVDWLRAFMALAGLVTEIEQASGYRDRRTGST